MLEKLIYFIFIDLLDVQTLIFIILFLVFFFSIRKKLHKSLEIAIISFTSMSSMLLLKEYFEIPRPNNAKVDISGYGFPSGHATGSMLLGILLYIYLAKKSSRFIKVTSAILISLLILMVGLSRIYFNVHTPLQVISGYILGAFWPILYLYTKKYYKQKRKRPES